MQTATIRPARLFTVEEANATLPLVKAITLDLQRLAQDLLERQQRLDALGKGRKADQSDPYQDDVEQIQEDLETDSKQLETYVEELRELGAEPKGLAEGLVDFPAMIDGRIVYLCWKLGESEIRHWHEIDAGFSSRQPLVEEVAAGQSEAHGQEFHDDA